MKLLILLLAFQLPAVEWLGNIDIAKTEAQKSHKLILVNFAGSDWCIPCIRLRKEILESEKFTSYAADNLVLLRADFPRLKKNRLNKEQTRLNEALADKYNPNGAFPLTLLIDADGKVLKKWDGFPDLSPEQFTAQISAIKDSQSNKH
ncbi:thioredoxin family protein [Mucilaginibacter sp. KACC 22773]|uniref:thioredoxin family protein n=1 Tax=Mucilaginibacter sp. KACC 22773 TaxID=3025671 RepID=UPI002366E325|nr:thioredoxin family protein [Mucilaginibacter sp. KACC 22773]WDF77101.1 thioredoxin family protein [Mucilaginibacter sp. KACC 22773]